MQMRFVADSMLGKLAKWLRVLGYDTHYQSCYQTDTIGRFVTEGRRLLSRHRKSVDRYDNAILICSDHVGEQLTELRESARIDPDPSDWFCRCLICNSLLEYPRVEQARENVPEYIFYHNTMEIRFCPSCERYYWPGSHRFRMVGQLDKCGFKGYGK